MKIFIKIVFVLSIFAPLTVSCTGGTYSEGYRMGSLTVFEVQGCAAIGADHGEGQLLLGRSSTTFEKDGKTINPWYFSADKEVYASIQAFQGKTVVIEYEETRFKGCLHNTKYMVKAVLPLITNPMDSRSVGKAESAVRGSGVRVGRIVKASLRGQVAKSYEIILQEGESGNNFKEMSIVRPDIYEFALATLKRGLMVRTSYKKELFTNPLTQDTSSEVTMIDLLEEPESSR